MNNSYVRYKFDKYIQKKSSEWLFTATANLGDHNGSVETGVQGVLYARLENGQVVSVYNKIAPSRFDTFVKIGINKTLPGIWQVIEVREVYSEPATGFIVNHAEQHEFGADDTLWLDRKQILDGTVLVADAEDSANFIVTIIASVKRFEDTYMEVAGQEFDLSSLVPSFGAYLVNVETDKHGNLTPHIGVNFGSPLASAARYIPIPEVGKKRICSVLLHDSMEGIYNRHIIAASFDEAFVGEYTTSEYVESQLELKSNIGHQHVGDLVYMNTNFI